MRVLLKAKDIPANGRYVVTKRNGEKKYTLRDVIKIHGSGTIPSQEFKAEGDARFLVSSDGSANAISGDVELLVELDEGDLFDMYRNGKLNLPEA